MTVLKELWNIQIDSDNYAKFKESDRTENWIAILNMFKSGKSLLEDWKTITLELYQNETSENEASPIPDFTMGVVTKAISANALGVLMPLISESVELLPLSTPYGPYFELNVKRLECLDTSLSIVKRFKNSGLIMQVEKYAFHWDKLESVHMFLLSELGLSVLFVSDAFKKTVEENHLTGLIFKPVPLV